MTVKTTRVGQRYTTTRLTLPPSYLPLARIIAGGVVVLLVLSAFILQAIVDARATPAPIDREIVYQPIYIVATPTPPLATQAPAVLAAPATAEPPTAAPVVEPPLVAAPIEVEVSSAPAAEAAPVEPAPIEGWTIRPMAAPGGSVDCVHTNGGGICAEDAWHPPLTLPVADVCAAWHPPQPYPEGCP